MGFSVAFPFSDPVVYTWNFFSLREYGPQTKESLTQALNRDITYCYATTGRYPESLEAIKKDYGLIYDDSLFFVDYRTQGSNIYPEVTIIERGR